MVIFPAVDGVRCPVRTKQLSAPAADAVAAAAGGVAAAEGCCFLLQLPRCTDGTSLAVALQQHQPYRG